MKKWIAIAMITTGMVGSLIAGITVGAHASATVAAFLGTDNAPQMSRQFVVGYAEGVSDAVSSLGDYVGDPETAPADPAAAITGLKKCFEADGRTGSQLADWALAKWRMAQRTGGGHWSAASVMLGEICK
jgi:hypothetical protein